MFTIPIIEEGENINLYVEPTDYYFLTKLIPKPRSKTSKWTTVVGLI